MTDPTKPRHNYAEAAKAAQNEGIQWKRWALGVAVVALLIVIAQNAQKVEFNLLFLSTTAPLILLLLGAAVVGAVIGYTAPILRRHRHNTRREYEKD
ncbi:MAG: lipopolysaccharide assembly protein LapA domain-containing protein [Solirubrobacterales bacterium]